MTRELVLAEVIASPLCSRRGSGLWVHLQWVAAGEGDEPVECAGGGGHRHRWVESGGGATLSSEGVLRQTEDVSGVGVRDVEGTVYRYGEIPAVDDEFERQDAEGKARGQCPPAEHNIAGQSAAPPFREDRLRKLLDALVDGIAVGRRGLDTGGGTDAGDGVDEMLGEGLHIEVDTGCGTVQVVIADRLDNMVHRNQRLLGTGEFVHGVS
jgi:PAS domain-containing protein